MSNAWSEKESEQRKKDFLKEYDKLVEKFGVALMAVPQYVPSGQNGFNTSAMLVPMDTKAIKSPLQAEEIIK